MKVNGVIMDWAGTAVDYGCMAPVHVFIDIFRSKGIEPTLEEVRAPMGLLKWDHMKTMLEMPRIGKLFEEQMGRPYNDSDVDEMHEEFEPKLLAILHGFAEPIEHVVDVVKQLRQAGLKIGGTTGYNDVMMKIVADKAEESGYAPDYFVTPDGVKGKGRPSPYMIYANMIQLDMGVPSQVVKVGDTESDMQEARNAGVWAIGVIKGSSMLGLTEDEVDRLEADELTSLMDVARSRFMQSGAHAVIEDMSQLPDIIETINHRLQEGEQSSGCKTLFKN
ncbi:phosphonoacetaldehyde hydrolase [Paenibacillus sp. GCM10012307]|uniref:Phosphonoacetaldehyde hydrolase n=1 Tax=Paenibacillus roseus TaxID=2798579 RepID=A0A934J1Y6_9BACL|nr:phosphonoacetaldehyde hydrolase [Paenibacillus roseus]MBJ6360079.1 phosphonoacetaldehyde hydrolase [Paenibacillus roseus]